MPKIWVGRTTPNGEKKRMALDRPEELPNNKEYNKYANDNSDFFPIA